VLAIAGHDPTGGAGIQADIEAIVGLGGRAVTLITALTAQNARQFQRLLPQEPEQLLCQARLLLADTPVRACKVGALGSAALAEAVAETLRMAGLPPVVLDPVLRSTTGGVLLDSRGQDALFARLLAHAAVLTPNLEEARRLSGHAAPARAAAALLDAGAAHVLITDTEAEADEVCNILYGRDGKLQECRWPRLAGACHGSGCTLSAAIAAGLAAGRDVPEASARAQEYTWRVLRDAGAPGDARGRAPAPAPDPRRGAAPVS